MSIYIGNDLEDRLEALEMENTSFNLEDRLKALETENALLEKHNCWSNGEKIMTFNTGNAKVTDHCIIGDLGLNLLNRT